MRDLDPRAVCFARAYHCPDCSSTTRLELDAFGVHHLTVVHDDTCPWLAARGPSHE